MDSNRELQVLRLHRRIHEYAPSEAELQELTRTHAELKAAIEVKFQQSRINSHYRFPLKGEQSPQQLELQPLVCDLHKQKSNPAERMVFSSMERHLSPQHLLLNKKIRRQAGPANETPKGALQQRVRTEASDYQLHKKGLSEETETSTALNGRLARAKPVRPSAGKENKERLSQTIKKGVVGKSTRKKQREPLCILDDYESALQLKKVHPQTAKAAITNSLAFDFNQSYQFQGLAHLAFEASQHPKQGANARHSSRRQQLPSEKVHNEQQRKLLTNRLSRQGRSIKNNYRLGIVEQDRRHLFTNR